MSALNPRIIKNNTLNVLNDTKWKLALEYTNIGFWEFDADLNKVYFSNESKKIIGTQNKTSFGSNINDWNERVHPDDIEKYYQDFQDHLNGLKPMYENEHRVKCQDGSYKWILDRGKIVEFTKDGIAKRVIGTHTEITNQKVAENKVIEALSIATEQNNKLKNFAHIVTHNLKQHVANFESLLQFHDEAETCEEKESLMNHLKTLSSSLTKTIHNLNQVVSVQTNKNKKIERIYVAKEINNVLKTLDFVIKESKATINNNVNERYFIYYNISYFESVIQNLLTNAIKYKHKDRNPVINIDSIFKKDAIDLIVTDNGIGIDLNKFGNDIFGLYKTFHKNEDAEGVGLYLIKNQIESFGGKISVASTVNTGTAFTITVTNK
ncbi:PAS domain-containing protein [Oceanihabitans sp. 2_MG-2023]|uniref:sensor histidine kinase n=1 Tax=Oceanihabitans sp. 2_MG-2023 TaxID=3062661 RepID=UPI0026E3042E|nr:PAS domain-containing protein [Oceanihabitans sp. 2_MG-2023]MDO6597525.1 PAS domain-containing protein [Oceanihabitans sp. 2_MG-2023]